MSDLANAGCDSCGGTPHQRLTCDGCVDDAVRTAVTDLRAENVRLTARVAELEAKSIRYQVNLTAERDTARAEAQEYRHMWNKEAGRANKLGDQLVAARAEVESLKAGNEKLFHQNTDLMTEVDDLKAALADSVPLEMFDSLKAQLAEHEASWRTAMSIKDESLVASELECRSRGEQLRVAREALPRLMAKMAQRQTCHSDYWKPSDQAAALNLANIIIVEEAALSASTPKVQPEHRCHICQVPIECENDCPNHPRNAPKAETKYVRDLNTVLGIRRVEGAPRTVADLLNEPPKAEHVAIEMGLLACTECEAPPHEGSCPEGPTKTEPNLKCDDCGKDAGIIVCTGCWEKHRGRADLMRVAERSFDAGRDAYRATAEQAREICAAIIDEVVP